MDFLGLKISIAHHRIEIVANKLFEILKEYHFTSDEITELTEKLKECAGQ